MKDKMIKNDYMKEIENTLKLVKEEVDKNIIEGKLLKFCYLIFTLTHKYDNV